MLNDIFSRELFLKKFLAHFLEASDKSCPKMNRNSEVPISFLELKLFQTITIWRKYEKSIFLNLYFSFEVVKIKFI